MPGPTLSFLSRMKSAALILWQHKGKALLVSTGSLVLVRYGARVYELKKAPEMLEVIPVDRGTVVFPRRAGSHIRNCAADGIHMLVLGPTGVGKTTSVKQAIDNRDPIESISSHTTRFLPFYVNLAKAVQSSRQLATGEGKQLPVLETEQQAIHKDAAKCVAAAFALESNKFVSRQLVAAERGIISSMAALFTEDLASGWEFVKSLRPTLQEPSIKTYLQHIVDAAKFSKQTRSYEHFFKSTVGAAPAQRPGIIPVIAIDEVHLLDQPLLQPIREEFVAVLWDCLVEKRSAPVVFILLSSDGNADKIIDKWPKYGSLTALLQRETVGDLGQRKELSEFLLKLAGKEPPADEVRYYAQGHQFARREHANLPQVDFNAGAHETSASQLQADVAALQSQKAPTYWAHTYKSGKERFIARVEDPDGIKRIADLYGGYIPDLLRLYHDQIDAPYVDIEVSDESKVAGLVKDPVTSLSQAGLDRGHVIKVFDAIVNSKLSPKGAVVIDVLQAQGVPTPLIDRMRDLNLIEIRQGNPPVLDYPELAPLSADVYVCATRPLARESMAKVVNKLKAQQAQHTGKSWYKSG